MTTIGAPMAGLRDAQKHAPTAADAKLAQLVLLPNWQAWTPIGRKKNAYLEVWSYGPQTKDQVRSESLPDRCRAVGLICGPVSDLLVMDHDGTSAEPLLQGQLNGEQLPSSWIWRSGRVDPATVDAFSSEDLLPESSDTSLALALEGAEGWS